jgi:hypothetical protein
LAALVPSRLTSSSHHPHHCVQFSNPFSTNRPQCGLRLFSPRGHPSNTRMDQNNPTTKFGQTYHTMTPEQWALQSLSHNISHALGKYLRGALLDLSHAKSCVPLKSRLNFYGPTPYSFRPRAPVLIAAAPHVPRTFHAEPPSLS